MPPNRLPHMSSHRPAPALGALPPDPRGISGKKKDKRHRIFAGTQQGEISE